jgi:hypothetical protein
MPPEPRKSTAKKTAAPRKTAAAPKTAAAEPTPAKKVAAKKTTTRRTSAKKAAAQTVPVPETPTAATQAPSVQDEIGLTAVLAQVDVEDALLRIRELQNQLLESARRGGAAYLQAYESNLSTMLALTEKAAESTQLSWAVTLANSYADFVRQLNDTILKTGWSTLG